MGHSKGVKAIDFTNDGTKFLSCSYDKYIKLWDTETGNLFFEIRIEFHPLKLFNKKKENAFLHLPQEGYHSVLNSIRETTIRF
jgi:pre-mRNA-processing factor 17